MSTDKSDYLDIISAELDREIQSEVVRASAMEQRATLLVGAASVVGALQTPIAYSWISIANLALSFLAAVAGVIVIFPRKGEALDVRAMRDEVLEMPRTDGRTKLIETKLEILEADEAWLLKRGQIARIGFVFLSLSIAIALVGAVI